MRKLTRRSWLRTTLLPSLAGWGSLPPLCATARTSTTARIRVEEVRYSYEDYLYRTPIKFGGAVVDRVTLLNVNCTVRARDGRRAKGFGSMPLGNVWSFPSQRMPYEATLSAMKALAERISTITASHSEFGHPIEINAALEPAYLKAAAELNVEKAWAEPIPKLCILVTASPFDAAVHDAFGKLLGRNCYLTYGKDLFDRDLADFLGRDFRAERLDPYVLVVPKPRMPLYHLVGALDPLVSSDIHERLHDGLPQTLGEWIEYNGLTHIKIKLNGNDLKWDVDRVVGVDRVSAETQQRRGIQQWVYSLDFNEKCPNVGYLLDFLHQLKNLSPGGYERIQYIEQPTHRDLKTHRSNTMHEAAKLRPIVIDESLTDLESLLLAREMGYSGVALKACKGQSQSILLAAAAQKYRMFLCVQDLTCPGASLIHSAGLAAHIPGVAAIESNARQYVPAANKGWEDRFPGIFRIRDGLMDTSVLTGPGLSAV